MTKVAWATDIHLDRLSVPDYLEYKEYIQELSPDLLIISGDIAEGEKVCQSLKDFDNNFRFPIYFVLGNHDFYWSSFTETENKIRETVKKSRNLNWLTESEVIKINESSAMIGVEGWGDAQNGTLNLSEGSSRDILSIADYKGLNREEIANLMESKGRFYAEKLRPKLIEAVNNYENVFLVTHVPPFIEACYDRSLRICNEFKLPFYSCKAIGDLLLEVMKNNPNCQLTVLGGHTHENADVQVLENLRVRIKESGYGTWWNPTIINIE